MPFHLNTTRILYQSSKYAPVAVVQLELEVPPEESIELSPAAGLDQISSGSSGDLLALSRTGSPLEVYCALVLGLQRYGGHSVTYSRAEKNDADQEYRVFIEYEDHATALYAAELAVDLLNALLTNPGGLDVDTASVLQQQMAKYAVFALEHRIDPNTRLLMRAAQRQGIPVLSLDQPWGMPTWPGAANHSGVVQFGWGINQRRCKGTLPIGLISQAYLQQVADRAQLLPRLKGAHLPLAGQDLEFINRNQVKRAQRSARRIGYPVTLRPRVTTLFQYKSTDNLVFGPIRNDDQVALVAGYLRDQGNVDIWVEAHVDGVQYRFLVLTGKVLSVVRCIPPSVVGDGMHTIAELIRHKTKTASDPATQRTWHTLAGDGSVLPRLQLEKMELITVPASGDRITLRGSATAYNGGSCEDVTQTIPAHFNTLALQVAELTGLEHLVGIDLTINDLSAPAALPNCAVTDLTPAPDLLVHSQLSGEEAHTIEDQYLEQLFPRRHSSRIPTVAVTGTNGKTTTCRMVTRILQTAGIKVGLSCTDGVYLGAEFMVRGDESGVLGANEVLANPEIEAAVLETARGNMANTGIAFDHCDVGACLNIADDHLGQEEIETLDDMALHKRQVIERTTGTVVLNVEDPRCLAMQTHNSAEEVILVAHNKDHPAIKAHLRAGGRAVVTVPGKADTEIATISEEGIMPLMRVNQIPATFDGKALFNVENAMTAAAIAIGLDIERDSIIKGLSSFIMSKDETPGRMNIYDGLPFLVIVDYAHNVHSLKAFCKFTRQLEIKGRRIVVMAQGRHRSDEEVTRNASVVAKEFDYFICRNSHHLGGRSKEELPALYKSALLEYGVEEDKIEMIHDPDAGIDKALSIAKPGDLLVIFMGHAFREKIEHTGTGPEAEKQQAQLVSSTSLKKPRTAGGVPS